MGVFRGLKDPLACQFNTIKQSKVVCVVIARSEKSTTVSSTFKAYTHNTDSNLPTMDYTFSIRIGVQLFFHYLVSFPSLQHCLHYRWFELLKALTINGCVLLAVQLRR